MKKELQNFSKVSNFKFPFILLTLLALLSCNADPPSEKRSKQAAKAEGDIVIGIVHSSAYSNFFLEGVRMAAEEINHRGGLSGRKIKTVVYDDKDNPETAKKIAEKLAKNYDVVAVLGHGNSDAALSASIIYEKEGIAFISYGAMDPNLTRYSRKFTLRNIPDYESFGYEIAQYALSAKFKKTAVFYERSPVHRDFTEAFKKQADNLGIRIIATRSYFRGENEFKGLISALKKTSSEFDSLFITGSLPGVAVLIRQLREMDVNVPILGGDGLDSPDLWATAGKASENTVVPTVFNPHSSNKLTRDFVRQFKSKYSFVPDTWAAQGYDALSVLASVIEKNRSDVPVVISSGLRFFEDWNGVTGSYSFTTDGNIKGKEIFFKKMKGGEFVFSDFGHDFKPDLFNYLETHTLRIPLKDPVSTLDPGLVRNTADREIAEQMFLGLTDLDPETYEPVPELATGWRPSTSGQTFIFYLRPDALWTNNEPVTANDVVWALQRNIRPETESPFAHMLYILKNAKAINTGKISDVSKLGVYAPDEFTVVFRLENPAFYFPSLTGLEVYRPLPKSVIEKHREEWTYPENIQTNGSYMLDSWEKGIGIFLKKNPGYYDEKSVSVPEIRYFVIPQPSLGMAMYENNELDIMGSSFLRLPSAAVKRIKKVPVLKDEYSKYPHFCTYTYAFNTKRPPADNPLVRKAVSSAINRHLLIDAENEGNGLPATTCTRPPVFGFVPPEEGEGIGFDPVRAREWLAQAGYPGGKGFPGITLLYRTSGFHGKIARAIKAHVEHHLNITVKLRSENNENYYDLVTSGNPPHMFRAKMCADYPDAQSWLSRFDPSLPFYRTGWKNKEFAKVISKARKTSDKEKRKAFYRRAEQILCKEDAVAVPLYFEIYHSMTKPWVKGWYHMPMGGQHVRNWRLEEE